MTENRALLEANIVAGNCGSKVQIIPWALCDKDGEEDLQVDDMMSGSATLDRVTGGSAANGRKQYGMPALIERVSVARLDHLMESHQLPAPDVIKVDIEGAEALMLQGARDTLNRYSPDLLVELHGASTACQVFQFLTELGYHCFGEAMLDGCKEYRQLNKGIVNTLSDYYDLHFLVASRDPNRLRKPIDHFMGGTGHTLSPSGVRGPDLSF